MTEPKPFGVINPDTHVTGARFSPCGRLIAAPSFDGKVRRWRIEQPGTVPAEFAPPELPAVTGHNGYVTAVDFHPSRLIAYSADSWGQLRAWPYQAETPDPLWTNAEAHDGWIRGIAVGGEGDWIATAGRDGKARVFSADTGGQLAEFGGHGAELFALAAHPSGKWVVSGDLFGRLIQWDVKTGAVVREFDAKLFHLLARLQDIGGLRKLYFSADGKTLAASGTKPNGGGNVQGHGRVLLFDFEKGTLRHEVVIGESDKDIFAHDMALMPDGNFITVTTGQPGQGNVMIFKPGEAAPLFTYNKGTVNCHSVSLSPDARWFAVSATNTGSNGNGRRLDKEGKYAGNFSPIHLFAVDGSTVPVVDPKKKKA